VEIPLTPLEFAARARQYYGDREAVVDGKVRLTYQQFFERCDRWSSALQALGIKAGDRVAYIAPNTHALLEAFYAVPQTGATLVPINYRLTGSDFAYILNHSGARIVCVHSDYLDTVDNIRAQAPNVEHFIALEGTKEGWLDYEAALAAATTHFVCPPIDERDLISINYTSGTTAHPKGVMITHRNAYLNMIGALLHFPLTPQDRYLWTLPMFHVNGWNFVWGVTARGATHLCLRKVDPEGIFDLIERENATVFCSAPAVLIAVANAPAEVRRSGRSGVRVLTGGAPPAAATIDRIEGELGWELMHAYGLTETSSIFTLCEQPPQHQTLSPGESASFKARQGIPHITAGELRVVDIGGSDVPRDGVTLGEIVVRGNGVMKGYFRDEEATEQAMRGGWFHTGDAAVVHADGYVEIRDRLKDVIISGGENISSVEVEGVLLRHPAVREAAIVGIPSEKWGESPHAFVVLREGATANEAEIKQFVREHLAHFKTPQSVFFVEELPKTATGKIQKYLLRSRQAAIPQE
jgi:fatty-acyl-CoA synthase